MSELEKHVQFLKIWRRFARRALAERRADPDVMRIWSSEGITRTPLPADTSIICNPALTRGVPDMRQQMGNTRICAALEPVAARIWRGFGGHRQRARRRLVSPANMLEDPTVPRPAPSSLPVGLSGAAKKCETTARRPLSMPRERSFRGVRAASDRHQDCHWRKTFILMQMSARMTREPALATWEGNKQMAGHLHRP